jgi:hypothetical protein
MDSESFRATISRIFTLVIFARSWQQAVYRRCDAAAVAVVPASRCCPRRAKLHLPIASCESFLSSSQHHAPTSPCLDWLSVAPISPSPCGTTTGTSFSFPEIRTSPYKSSRLPAIVVKMPVSILRTILVVLPTPGYLHQDNLLTTSVIDGQQLPTLTCYVGSLPPSTPFRISVHSWSTTARPSTVVESLRKPNQKIVYMVQVVVDGTRVLYDLNTVLQLPACLLGIVTASSTSGQNGLKRSVWQYNRNNQMAS